MQPFRILETQALAKMSGDDKKVGVSHRWSCTTLGDGLSQLAGQSQNDEDEAALLAQLEDQKSYNM